MNSSKNAEHELRSRYKGSRILLVEDNEIVIDVTSGMLNDLNLDVDTAENGSIAVDKVSFTSYDLVLMDVQMPEMDGLEATRIIRSLEENTELPIVAMTANAQEEDRKACTKAGMNDFVEKPIDPQHLFSTLLKWLPQHKTPKSVQENSTTPSASPEILFDEAMVRDQLSGIKGFDLETADKIVPGGLPKLVHYLFTFDTSHSNDGETLTELMSKGERDQARILTHTLKGAAGMLGLSLLHKVASELEQMLRNESTRSDDKVLKALINTLRIHQQLLHTSLEGIKPGIKSGNQVMRPSTREREVANIH